METNNWRRGLDAIAATREQDQSWNSRNAGWERETSVLQWLLRQHVTTPRLLTRVAGSRRRGYVAHLERRGLVKRIPWASIHGRYLVVLTEIGVAEALARTGEDVQYDLRSDRAYRPQLVHTLAGQAAVLEHWNTLTGYRPERLIGEPDQNGVKRPDALIEIEGKWHGLEVELSPKSGRDLDNALRTSAAMIDAGEVHGVFWYFISAATAARYRDTYQRPIGLWAKDAESGKWRKHDSKRVSDAARARTSFVVTNLLRML